MPLKLGDNVHVSTSISSRIHLPEPFPETSRITREQVVAFLERLIELYQPERILVFGSYANGQPGGDSDIDFLVIMPYEGRRTEKAIDVVLSIPRKFPLDLLVRSRQEVADLENSDDWIGWVAVQEGREVYAA